LLQHLTATRQSLSVKLVQPAGQQPSPLRHWVIGVKVQEAPQVPALLQVSMVQTLLSLQLASAEQAGAAHLPEQQTPPVQAVLSATFECEQEALGVPGFRQTSLVHSLESLQSVSEEQAGPAGLH
jgi:hypothetical protein